MPCSNSAISLYVTIRTFNRLSLIRTGRSITFTLRLLVASYLSNFNVMQAFYNELNALSLLRVKRPFALRANRGNIKLSQLNGEEVTTIQILPMRV